MKVLVLDAQLRSAVAMIRSLGKKGITVYAGDSDRISTGFFSKYVYKKFVYPNRVRNEKGFIESVRSYIEKENIDVIFPIKDRTVLIIAKNREAFGDRVKIPIADYSKLINAGNKALTQKIAEKLDVPAPKTFYPETLDDLDEIDIFPVILKPVFSSGSRGVVLCENKDRLVAAFKKQSEEFESFIIQDYIPIADKENSEFDWYGICDWDAGLKAHGCFRRIRSYPIHSGPSTLKESVEDERINEIASKILDHLKWQGLVQIDFRIDARDGQPKLMEINPRLWASVEHSIRIGMDVAGIWLKLALGEHIPKQPLIKTGIKSRWLLPGDILWFLSAPKTLKNIKSFISFGGVDYELIQRGDWKPVWGFLMASILYLVDKEKRKFIIR